MCLHRSNSCTWYFLNLDYEVPLAYLDVIDTDYWSLPLLPCLQAHKCVRILTVVIGTCNCAWCLETCAWSSCSTCNIIYQHKEISFAIKVIRFSEEKKLAQSDFLWTYTLSNFYICINLVPHVDLKKKKHNWVTVLRNSTPIFRFPKQWLSWRFPTGNYQSFCL